MLKSSDMMRIATFNIWNHESFWGERLEAICEEVRNISPHILAQPTLDYGKNTNLIGDEKQGERYDWVMIQENDAFEFPNIENVSIFADSALTSSCVFPGDHYGVFVDLKFEK
ncbi:hypothetical protein [Bacillus cereus]|uniref:hypothetical protein n=1 Tax=Bacillus cereus TaxID=1396 RepID=UPI0018794DEA|nr:hypothetical protein [Bacillus cereus]MBE7120065.1 hypothetical protein [Bacillus cereus]